MALTKSQIAEELEAREVGRKRQMMAVLDALAEIGQEELAAGESFTIPNLVKLDWGYTAPRAKGSQYKKGETYVGFGGVEQVAEADSKARKASFKLVAKPAAPVKRLAPSKETMARFANTRLGKAIVARKG